MRSNKLDRLPGFSDVVRAEVAGWRVRKGARGHAVESTAVEQAGEELDRGRTSYSASDEVRILDSEISGEHAAVAATHGDDGAGNSYITEEVRMYFEIATGLSQ